MFEIDDLKRKL